MEGTEPHKIGARLAQLDVIADDLDDIRRRPNFFNLAHDSLEIRIPLNRFDARGRRNDTGGDPARFTIAERL